jgi:hypothetical protein
MGGKGSGRRGRGRGPKDPFEDLPSEFKDAVMQSNEGDIRARLANVALDQQALIEAEKIDLDFQSKKEAAKVAGEVYRAGKKLNQLKIKFMRQTLQSQGKL